MRNLGTPLARSRRAQLITSLLGGALLAAGCLPTEVTCDDGTLCPAEKACVAGGGCAAIEAIQACADKVNLDGCVLPDVGAGVCVGGVCTLPICGDGVREGAEACDDGNRTDGDGCSAFCSSLEQCGNSVRDVGEGCDDGNLVDGDGCQANCDLPACGDGVLDAGAADGAEACDDGNRTDGDGCSAACRLESCGNGVRDAGETCDDGNLADGDGCQASCQVPRCGDHVVDSALGEVCDDGNQASGDGCAETCRSDESCGNGVRDIQEACDDGNDLDTDACVDCALARCGDGEVQLGVEVCDDGNDVDEDDCRNNCALPSCGDGVVQAGEACDDGAANGEDRACLPTCALATCGDGRVHLGAEACDDGNQLETDACTTACTLARCGDGNLQLGIEACDDGNDVDGDACRSSCALPSCGDGVLQAGEACDNGVANGDDRACLPTCALAACGDGRVHLGVEACDDGNALETDACTTACAPARCGDGHIQLGVEACDDGNQIDDDGCRNSCVLPACGDAVIQAGEACDDGAANGDDRACLSSCEAARCGDGNIQAGVEACDDGAANGDAEACTSSCDVNVCGDGHAWVGVEACDDGNVASGDGCRADCAKLEVCGDATVDAGEACDDGAAGYANAADGCDACVATSWLASTLLGAPATVTTARLASPAGVAVDAPGNVFVADTANHRILRIAGPADPAPGTVTTVAGIGAAGSTGNGGPATSARLSSPRAIAVDGLGNLFIADTGNFVIRRVSSTGTITLLAGTGANSFSGDGGLATSAAISTVTGLAVDGLGNLYLADSTNHRVRRVVGASAGVPGVISTFAGTGTAGALGDGGPATSAQLRLPNDVAVDAAGTVWIADTDNHRIRRVEGPGAAFPGRISTIAGTGVSGNTGDGGLATAATLTSPTAVRVSAAGNLYVAQKLTSAVRRIAGVGQPGAGTITRWAGDYFNYSYGGDGGPATSAALAFPGGIAVGALEVVYIADTDNQRIRAVSGPASPAPGVITTFAGSGSASSVSEGGAGTSAALASPAGMAADAAGNLYFAETGAHLIRRIAGPSDASPGTITTVAGNGISDWFGGGYSGDGGPATSAQLRSPGAVSIDPAGNLYIADTDNHRVRRVDGPGSATPGVITTIAGNGMLGSSGDGGPATSALLNRPGDVAVDAFGNAFIADTENHRIRRVEGPGGPSPGTITTVAGTGSPGASGDGGAATSAQLYWPTSVALDSDGNLYIADWNNQRIRMVAGPSAPVPGRIATVAGSGGIGYSGDGGPATAAALFYPTAVDVDAAGNLYIADRTNQRVRRVGGPSDPAPGIITTVGGDGNSGYRGDGGAATAARFAFPAGVATSGTLVYVGDTGNHRVRRIDLSSGRVATVAGGNDPIGMGPIGVARLALPRAMAVTPSMTLFAGDASGTLQALRSSPDLLEVVAGRYPHPVATSNLARFRASSFGSLGGVAHDAATNRVFIAESSANRLHVITQVNPDDEATWTIAVLAGDAAGAVGAAGFVDGAALSARFRAPSGLFFDGVSRVLYVADSDNHAIRAMAIDLAGVAGNVTTIAGMGASLGFLGDGGPATSALLYRPAAVTRCANGDLFIADAGNHRVRRVAAADGRITTVLGDGVAASSGQGRPATAFPVDNPRGVACDAAGNLFVTSTTTVRLLPAAIPIGATVGVVDGTGAVQTIFGSAPRNSSPANVASCLSGLAVVDDETTWVVDDCVGMLVELWRQPTP